MKGASGPESERRRRGACKPRKHAAFCRSRSTCIPKNSRSAARKLLRSGRSLRACATAARSLPRRSQATR
eukprot:1093506-Pleurochrysis_carterae.AAC.1